MKIYTQKTEREKERKEKCLLHSGFVFITEHANKKKKIKSFSETDFLSKPFPNTDQIVLKERERVREESPVE